MLEIDRAQAERFLTLLDEEAEGFTFQTLDDRKSATKRGGLVHTLHGSLGEHFDRLRDLNQKGAGIFVTVNRTDLKGRKKENITGIRAIWQDDDGNGSGLPVEPHVVVQTSIGKFHRYVFTDGPVSDEAGFNAAMGYMVQECGSDPNAVDLPRILRLPGFLHMKNPSNSQLVKIVSESGEVPLNWAKLKDIFKRSGNTSSCVSARSALSGGITDWIEQIRNRENFHDSLLRFTGSLVSKGLSQSDVSELAKLAMNSVPESGRDERWDERVGEIPRMIKGAVDKGFSKKEDDWSDPEEIMHIERPDPYPIDALPDEIRAAVLEAQGFFQAPIAMVATSALSSLSLASQARADVSRTSGLEGPVSIFSLTIAESGERKSACDAKFMVPIREYQEYEAFVRSSEIKAYEASLESWKSQVSGLKASIQASKKDGSDVSKAQEQLQDLYQKQQPVRPKVPRLIFSDITPEELVSQLGKGWPSAGVCSSEAGIVFGSYGMSKDSVMRNFSVYNKLWDGGSVEFDRKTSDSGSVKNGRLTVSLQVQSETLRAFMSGNGALARGIGFLARFLICRPESTQGTRHFVEPPQGWPSLTRFHWRLREILNEDVEFSEDGSPIFEMLYLSPEAKEVWVDLYNLIESRLGKFGDLSLIPDVASKSPENIARLAALFCLYDGGKVVQVNHVERAGKIALWYLEESRKFFASFSIDSSDAALLDRWLIDYCLKHETNSLKRSDALQYGPYRLRNADKLKAPLKDLQELGRLRLRKESTTQMIYVNPHLIAANSAKSVPESISEFSNQALKDQEGFRHAAL